MTPRRQPPVENGSSTPRRESGFDLWISRTIRIAGLVIALYETFIEKFDRPTILGTAMLMMSGTLAYDAIRRKLSA